MGEIDYPDRAEWPHYWPLIRTASSWFEVVIIVTALISLLPRPADPLWRFALSLVTGLLVVAGATTLARWMNDGWERRSA